MLRALLPIVLDLQPSIHYTIYILVRVHCNKKICFVKLLYNICNSANYQIIVKYSPKNVNSAQADKVERNGRFNTLYSSVSTVTTHMLRNQSLSDFIFFCTLQIVDIYHHLLTLVESSLVRQEWRKVWHENVHCHKCPAYFLDRSSSVSGNKWLIKEFP